MNRSQKQWVVLGLIATVIMLLVPPWVQPAGYVGPTAGTYSNDVFGQHYYPGRPGYTVPETSLGFKPVFDAPPTGKIDWMVLLIDLAVVGAIVAIGVFCCKSAISTVQPSPTIPQSM
jgi:hypothetical protein